MIRILDEINLGFKRIARILKTLKQAVKWFWREIHQDKKRNVTKQTPVQKMLSSLWNKPHKKQITEPLIFEYIGKENQKMALHGKKAAPKKAVKKAKKKK